jgi:hypothetical protein
LSLATLTVGESSPFRGIARRVFVGDLSDEASQTLILELLNEHCIAPPAQHSKAAPGYPAIST